MKDASFGEQEELGDDIEWGLIDRKGEEIIKAKRNPLYIYIMICIYIEVMKKIKMV